jgi:hypothetical protein
MIESMDVIPTSLLPVVAQTSAKLQISCHYEDMESTQKLSPAFVTPETSQQFMGEWIFDARQTLLVLSSNLQKTKGHRLIKSCLSCLETSPVSPDEFPQLRTRSL